MGIFFQRRGGAVHRFPIGNVNGRFTVSAGGTILIVSGQDQSDNLNKAIWYALPSLTELGHYQTASGVSGFGLLPVAAAGTWSLIDTLGVDPGNALEFTRPGGATATLTNAWLFDVSSAGAVLRRVDHGGQACYDVVAYDPRGQMSNPTGHCILRSPADPVDSGALSPDGNLAALALDVTGPAVIVKVTDLQAGRWRPITLPMKAQIEYWDSATTVIVHGEHFYRCHTDGTCDQLPGNNDNTLVREDETAGE
jgi:hypothetical protein